MLEAPVTVNDKGKPKRMTTLKAVIWRVREGALKGNHRSMNIVLEQAARIYGSPATEPLGDISRDDQAILDAYREEIRAETTKDNSGSPNDDSEDLEMNAPLSALLRTDLRYFVRKVFSTVLPGTTYLPNWHIDAIVHELMRIDSGENRRLLINQPPRSLKSICVSIAYVAWLLGPGSDQAHYCRQLLQRFCQRASSPVSDGD